MRRSLVWALVATGALSSAALWTDGEAPLVVLAVASHVRDRAEPLNIVAVDAGQEAKQEPLPASLVATSLSPAKRDVFAPKLVAPPPALATAPKADPAPPPPPQAPLPNLRFMGWMVDPAGKRLVYLARGDAAVLVGPGDRLDEGYVVESLKSDAVVLVYPSLNARATVPIPPEPR